MPVPGSVGPGEVCREQVFGSSRRSAVPLLRRYRVFGSPLPWARTRWDSEAWRAVPCAPYAGGVVLQLCGQ